MYGNISKLTRTPGSVRHVGPELGADTDAVLDGLLGTPAAARAQLRADGVIA